MAPETGRELRQVRDGLRGLPRARGYLAGFGTSGSLLAGAAVMFILASALVAFRGWPHVGTQPSPGEVVLAPQPAAAIGTPVARRLARIGAVPVARGAAVGPAGGVAPRVRGGVIAPALAPGARRSIGMPASTSLPVGGPAGVGGSVPALPASGVGGSVPALPAASGVGGGTLPSVGSAPAQPVQQLQQGVAQATGGLGNVVSGAGSTVGSVVQQTTDTAAGAV